MSEMFALTGIHGVSRNREIADQILRESGADVRMDLSFPGFADVEGDSVEVEKFRQKWSELVRPNLYPEIEDPEFTDR